MGTVIAGRYRVVASIGKGSFSRVVQCHDQKDNRSVSVKVLHNDKDCIDQGIGEIRLLTLLSERDDSGEIPIVRLLDYFYHKARRAPRPCPSPLPALRPDRPVANPETD